MNFNRHLRETVTLATPVVLSQLGHITVAVADSAMVGVTGTVPLAAAAFAGSTFYAVMLFGIGISYALTPLTSKAIVNNDIPRLGALLKNAILLYGVAGFALAGLLYAISLSYHHMGQDSEVASEAIPYLQLLAVSLIPVMFYQIFRQFLEGLSKTRQAMIISLAANLLNIALNYVLIFGKYGFPEMGLVGAGIATVIARVVAAILLAAYVMKGRVYQLFVKAMQTTKLKWAVVKELLSLGLPSGLQLVFEVTAFGVSAIMVGWISKTALAAHQIALNVSAVTYMIYTGISAGAAIRVGTFFGKGDHPNQRSAGIASFTLVTISVIICGVLFILLKELLPTFYSKDLAVTGMASSIFVIVAFYQFGDGLQVVGLGALRGLTDVRVPTIVTLITYWPVALGGGYLMAFNFGLGVHGVWWGLMIGLTLAGFLHAGRFLWITRHRM
ncbi:MAG: MATE family efflux transporter [Bacteroidota bacterium]